jgi:serine/threonine-protein kinase HipA
MKTNCLYCYLSVEEGKDFHEKCASLFFNSPIAPIVDYSLDEMEKLAKDIVDRSISVPGVQAKLSISVDKSTKDKSNNRLTVVGALGGNYIFKPPTTRFPEMPENEHLTMRIAELLGMKVVPSSLIRLKSGELGYITKRIDRDDDTKIHMLDMFQITEAFDKYKGSMEKIGKAIHLYSENTLLDSLFFFEITLFSFLTGNNDMHLKNFSMIENARGWTLAPAYDLLNVAIVLPEDEEELALTLSGKKKKLKREHFEQFAKELGLTTKQIKGVFNRFEAKWNEIFELIDVSFLSNASKNKYKELMDTRFKRIYH